MSIESARQFADKMKQDEEFRNAFMAAGSQEKAMKMVNDKGYDFTIEEIAQVRHEYKVEAGDQGELSDKDLEQVAGGGGWCWDNWCWG